MDIVRLDLRSEPPLYVGDSLCPSWGDRFTTEDTEDTEKPSECVTLRERAASRLAS